MVHHSIDPLHRLDGLLQLLGRDAYAAGNLLSQIRHAVLIQIHHSRKPCILGEDLGVLRIVQVVLDSGQVGNLSYQIRENGIVDGRRTS